jgi:hypothetical protein
MKNTYERAVVCRWRINKKREARKNFWNFLPDSKYRVHRVEFVACSSCCNKPWWK